MQTDVHNPAAGIYAPTADYVHALEARGAERLLFVAGTMGLDGAGVAPPTLERQLALLWANIETILRSAGMTLENVVRVTSYLADAASAGANAAARCAALRGRVVPTTAIVVGLLSDEWLVEVEVIAAG